jgi:transcriptional regulator with XRE-family HTH domain
MSTTDPPPSPHSITCRHCGCTPPQEGVDRYVGGIVSDMRMRHGMSQGDLAQKLGLSASQVSRLESGTVGVQMNLLPRLADALRIPISDLIPGEWLSRG